jgi:parallel beta-helix repeat protein
VLTRDLIVRNNHVHDNLGRGLWTNIDNLNSLIEDNLVEDNDQSGIAHEISYAVTIRNNTVRNNGLSFDNWGWGAQILIQNSSGTTVTGNTVTVSAAGGDGITVVNQNRGSGDLGAYISENITVTGNDVTYLGDVGQSGVADDTNGFSCQNQANVTFEGNTYRVASLDNAHWFW